MIGTRLSDNFIQISIIFIWFSNNRNDAILFYFYASNVNLILFWWYNFVAEQEKVTKTHVNRIVRIIVFVEIKISFQDHWDQCSNIPSYLTVMYLVLLQQ